MRVIEAARARIAAVRGWWAQQDTVGLLTTAWADANVRTLLTALGTAVAYYVGAQLSIALTFPDSLLSVIWPPNALLLVGLLLVPTRQWWILVLAVLPAHLLVELHSGFPPATVAGTYCTNCTEAVLGAAGMRHFAGGPPWFDSLRKVEVYFACAVVAAPFLTSFLDTGVIVLTGAGTNYWLLWQERFLSNMLTYLTVPPVILTAISNGPAWLRTTTWQRYIEAGLLALGVVVVGLLVFRTIPPGSAAVPALLYAPLPILLWAAARFGVGGTSAALLGITLLSAILDPRNGSDIFNTASPATDVLALQLFLIVIAAPFLFLAVLLDERRKAETALRESEKRYRAFFELNAVGASEADPKNGQILRCNEALSRITWYSREELQGMAFSALTHPADRQEDFERYQRLVRGEISALSAEKRYVRKDGQTIWVQVDVTMLRAHGGEPLHSIASILDITERKEAEQALRASEERYRDLVESQTEMICRYRPDTTLTFVNDAYCRYFGRSREELLGQKFLELIDEPARQRAIRYTDVLLAHPHPSVDEHEITLPDGSRRWHQWVDHAICDEKGNILEFQAVGRDITERKQAEEALLESQQRYALATTAGNVSVFDYDVSAATVYTDPVLATILGIEYQKFQTASDWLARIHPDDRGQQMAAMNKAMAVSAPRDEEGNTPFSDVSYRLVHADGSVRWVLARGTVLRRPDGSPHRVIGTVTDISERRRALEAMRQLTAQLLQAQDDERRRIARDLHDGTAQQLFAMTLNLARLEQMEEAFPGGDGKAKRLLSETRALGDEMLKEMRTLSYLLHPPLLDEAGLVSAVKWYVEGFSERSGIAVEVVTRGEVVRMPSEIETTLFRIVQESLTNIHRHSGSRSAQVRLVQDASKVTLRIRDRGSGMTATAIERLAGEHPMLGVGIPGMRERVRQLGGRLDVASGPRGTTVVASVPLVPASELAQQASARGLRTDAGELR